MTKIHYFVAIARKKKAEFTEFPRILLISFTPLIGSKTVGDLRDDEFAS